VCIFLGIFFLFERTLFSLGNLSFMIGLTFLLGIQKTFRFFFRREKKLASSAFFAGFLLVLFGWAFTGTVVEMYGFWKLFSAFLPNVIQSLRFVPGMNVFLSLPGIRKIVDYANDQRRLPL
jgi:polyadenylate-binding protein 2